MSTTINTAFEVYRSPFHVEGSASSEDLFAESAPAVIVMAQFYSSNDAVVMPRWRIDFIGTEVEFGQRYLPQIKAIFATGCSRLTSSQSVSSVLLNAFIKAPILTAQVLANRGYEAYSWSARDAEYIAEQNSLEPFTIYGDRRYAGAINGARSVEQMINQALEVGAGRPDNEDRVWFAGLWSMRQVDYMEVALRAA